ncbi:MAG: hypothetical protein Fur003_5120 [Candidatus Dojkabacteria bacterium]
MTKKSKIGILLLLMTLVPGLVFAQNIEPAEPVQDPNEILQNTTSDTTTEEEAPFTNPFTIEVIVGTQSPWTKKVPITVKVKPNIDTTRTQITWSSPTGVELKDNQSDQYYKLPKGEVYTRTVKVKPLQGGNYTIAATATDWGYGENVTNSESVSISFDDSLLVTPRTADYSAAVLAKWITILVITVVGGFLLFLLGKRGLKLLKEWLKPPEL